MKITINGTSISLDKEMNLLSLLEFRNVNSKGIAIAINEEVIPRNQWETVFVKENDHVIIITATAGG